MDKIIKWLIGIEQEAGDLYSAAAERFKANEQFSEFLSNLAADEYWHHQLIESAAEVVRNGGPEYKPAVILDTAIRSKTEESISICREKLLSGAITISDVMDCIIAIEFSEWNDVFLYVIETMKSRNEEFRSAVLKLRAHREKIKLFVHSSPEGGKYAEDIKRLPHVWNRNILIVEDEPAIAKFLAALLEEEGVVQIVENGQMALDKISEQYFDVILTDVKMPVMNGIEFFKRAAAVMPDIGKRFVFFSGSADEQRIAFFEQNRLHFLIKPSPIREILRNVHDILKAASDKDGNEGQGESGDPCCCGTDLH
jgi:CheY-like chemotaxis protein/rubrerythrin